MVWNVNRHMLYLEVWSGQHSFQSLGQPVSHYWAILYWGSYFPKVGKKKHGRDGGATAGAQLDLLSELSSVCCQTCFLFSKNLLKWKIAINTPGDKWLQLEQVFGLIQRNRKSPSRSYRRALKISRKWQSDLFLNNPCSMPRCCVWATNSSVADQLKYCSVCLWFTKLRLSCLLLLVLFFPVHMHRDDDE